MLRGYLSLCPRYGSLFYRQLLLHRHRPISSDQDCEVVAKALEEMQFTAESRAVYAERGRYWLRAEGNYSLLRETVARNAAVFGSRPSSRSSGLAKAAYYYSLAQDEATVSLLLEASLYRCMAAVVDCSKIYFLDMLHFPPGPPLLPQRPGQLQIPLPLAPPSSSSSSAKQRHDGDGRDSMRMIEDNESSYRPAGEYYHYYTAE